MNNKFRTVFVLLISGLFGQSVFATPIYDALDLSGISNSSPNFSNQTFTQGTFSTQFDGAVQFSTSGINLTDGNADGDIAFGGSSNSSITYELAFDDEILLNFSNEISIGFVTGPFDVWMLSSADTLFSVSDIGLSDINVLSNSVGSISFTGALNGDQDWSISTSALSSINISFINVAGGGNIGPINVAAANVSEPAGLTIILAGFFVMLGLRQRRKIAN